jgi:hypothetical protein
MRFTLNLLLLSVLLPVFGEARNAAPKKLAGEQAAVEAYSRACELSFAKFEAGVAARRLADKPVYDKEARILSRHARFDKIGAEQNADFIRQAEMANRGEATPSKVFLFSENAVLKELNDKVVEDKDLVTALTNLRKDLEYFHLQQDPELAPFLSAQYSDFKGHQLGLSTTDPKIVAKAVATAKQIDEKLGAYLKSIALERGWDLKGSGLASDPRKWFHGGIGASPDEAALAGRDSRTRLGADGLPVMRHFIETKEGLLRAGRATELYQRWVAKRFARVEGFLVDAGNGKKVLSAEAIEAMKKATPKTPTAEGYRAAVQDVIFLRFKIRLNEKEADALKDYMAQADRFSPPLLIEKRVVIDMGQNAAGVVSADFKGQNARNLEETLKALARSEGADLATRVKEVRAGEAIATRALDGKKARFQRVLERVVPGLEAEFSGDDGMGFLKAPFTEAQKLAFAKEWAKDGGGAEDLRLTFEEFHYKDSGALMRAEARSRFVVSAESVEKKLRGELIGRLSRAQLNGMQILVSLDGAEQGAHTVNLILLSKEAVPGVEENARLLTESLGFKVGSVKQVKP